MVINLVNCEFDKYNYSMNFVEQKNPTTSKNKNTWSNMGNAIDCNDKFASSKYTIKNKKVTIPDILASADFRLNIPHNAYINKVTIQVRMRIDNNGTKVKAPHGRFMIYNGKGKVTQQKTTGKTGWYGSTYRYYPTKNLSTSWQTIDYVISGTEWNKMKYPSKQLNGLAFGIDLHFSEPTTIKKATGVQVNWARVKVDYVTPNYRVTYSPKTTVNNALEMKVNDEYCVEVFFENTTKANGGTQKVNIELPYGTELQSYSPTSANFVKLDKYNYRWTVDGKGLAKDKIRLCLKSKVFGLKSIVSSIGDLEFPFYIYPYAEGVDYGDLLVTAGTIQKGEPSCFKFFAKSISNDSSIIYTVTVDGENQTDWSKFSNEYLAYYNNPNHGNCILTGEDGYIAWELEQDSMAQGVSIDWENTNNNQIKFNIPEDTEVEIKWTGCFIPLTDGDNTLYVVNGDTGGSTTYEYTSLGAEHKSITSVFDGSKFYDHRVISQITSGAYFLAIGVKDTDSLMVQQECTLKAYMWKDLAYIGCVPIQHSHYEPDHSTTNDGISETFKNITYKGKKMEIKEETSLKIKLPPRDWTTLQGLVQLDKPIPVNTVPTAFEGDVLNHRGWAEITGIKGVSKTNPLYYDGEVELDYLTHNINTRFTIKRGGNASDAKKPNLLASVISSGDEFASYTYVNEDGETVTNPTGYFIVDTDGAYIYDSDMNEESRTLISLDNSQYLTIKSIDPFTTTASFTMKWHSTKIAEDRENNIEREIYLLDDTDTPIFKYVYYDYEFDITDEYYSCMVKAEKLIDNQWVECINKKMYLATDVESLQLEVDSNGNIVQESEPPYDALIPDEDDEEGDTEIYEFNDYTYGSSLSFSLNGNVLSVVDSGLNGKQISESGITLSEGTYKLLVSFKNKNIDSDTSDVITFFDFEVNESILTSDYGLDYSKLYISSFPIANKELLFTRVGEEGTIYYWKGEDNEEFSYIQEPFYMYSGGVDLTAGDGQSIFNLNNSYSIFYMQNGLVRIGFNRLNGELYISKFDLGTRQYINVARLQCTNVDFTLGTYSDDKIQIVAGTTVYSMYRGHPYIVINHPDEEILFETSWNKVFSEKLNDEAYDFPVLFDLLNHQNLLPSSVGGDKLSFNDLVVTDEENTDITTFPSLTLTVPETVYTDEEAIFSVSGTVDNVSDSIPIELDSFVGNHGTYSVSVEVDENAPKWFSIYPNSSAVMVDGNLSIKSSLEDYEHKGVPNQVVFFYIVEEEE